MAFHWQADNAPSFEHWLGCFVTFAKEPYSFWIFQGGSSLDLHMISILCDLYLNQEHVVIIPTCLFRLPWQLLHKLSSKVKTSQSWERDMRQYRFCTCFSSHLSKTANSATRQHKFEHNETQMICGRPTCLLLFYPFMVHPRYSNLPIYQKK